MEIKEITICLHCGSDRSVVDAQRAALSGLERDYSVSWNNRIDRFPFAYPSYSKLLNEAISTSPTEFVILINDRTFPTEAEARRMIDLLEQGFACVYLYNIGFMGISKEVVRQIGWFDERFLNGGYEDWDWPLRLRLADLAIYESQESSYDHSWKSPLQNNDRCALSRPHFEKKWSITGQKIKRQIQEEAYDYPIGEKNNEISSNWLKSSSSVYGIEYNKPNSGPPPSHLFMKDGKQFREIEDENK